MSATKAKNILLLGIVMLFAVTIAACSFDVSTANISSLKLSKDKEGTKQTSSFGLKDDVYANGTISNAPGKVKLRWRLIVEKVEGQPENAPATNLDRSFDLEGDGHSDYHLSAPQDGWPPGKYKVEFSLLDESGVQKDQKIAPFTMSE